jgi:DNA polymerase III delta prime subunit
MLSLLSYSIHFIMTSTIVSTVDSFIKTNGITGNTIIDSIIIASIVPMVLAYMNGTMDKIQLIGGYLFKLIVGYILDKLKSKFIGKVLCSISISEDNRIFIAIKEKVFDPAVVQNVSPTIIRRICGVRNENDTKDKENWYSYRSYYDKFNITLDYTGNRLFRIKKNYSSVDIDTKVFKYKEYYIKFTLQFDSEKEKDKDNKTNGSNGNKMIMELITMGTALKSINEFQYASEIEYFLKDHFQINDYITYHYHIQAHDTNMKQPIKKFMTDGLKNGHTGLLDYGDGKFNLLKDDINVKALTNKLSVSLSTQNVSVNDANFQDKIILMSNSYDSAYFEKTGFFGIYEQFIGKRDTQLASYAYYIDAGKIILLWYDQYSNFYIEIISAGKILNEEDVKGIVEFIIKKGMSSNQRVVVNKEKNLVNAYKYTSIGGGWVKYTLEKRTFENIFIQQEIISQLKKELENFIRVEKLYRETCIPYRKGILLYGPPGTGKSSLVKVLAYEYQLNMYMININDKDINDDTITDMLNSIGGSGNKILLFEDIDSAFATPEELKFGEKIEQVKILNTDQDKGISVKNSEQNHTVESKRKYLTYSGLINALDGVLSNHHGVITIMTTNHIERLGEALIRPGRIDNKYYLGTCNYDQIYGMAKYIIDKSIELIKTDELTNLYDNIGVMDAGNLETKLKEFASKLVDENKKSTIKPCKLQQHILKNIENLDDIFNSYQELTAI